jgi:hypothetical protein
MTSPPIDHNVPVPNPRNPRIKNPHYPFTKMQVGDSFAVPVEESPNMIRRLRHSLTGQASNIVRAAGAKGTKFVSHYMPEEKAVRIWRVK